MPAIPVQYASVSNSCCNGFYGSFRIAVGDTWSYNWSNSSTSAGHLVTVSSITQDEIGRMTVTMSDGYVNPPWNKMTRVWPNSPTFYGY